MQNIYNASLTWTVQQLELLVGICKHDLKIHQSKQPNYQDLETAQVISRRTLQADGLQIVQISSNFLLKNNFVKPQLSL